MIDYDNTPCYQVFPLMTTWLSIWSHQPNPVFLPVVKTKEKQIAENPRADLNLNQEKNGWPGAPLTHIRCRGGGKKFRMRHI